MAGFQACGQGKGFNSLHNHVWQNAGCGTTRDGLVRLIRRALAFAVAGACVVGLLRACSQRPGLSGPTSAATAASTASVAELEATVAALRTEVSCTKNVDVEADLSVYDRARGFDCLRHDGHAIIVRAYAHVSTIGPVVTEWSPTFGKGRSWTRGEHWVAFGPREQLLPLARDHDGSAVTSRTTTVGPEAEVGARDSCMAFVSGAASEAVTDAARYGSEAKQLDAQYPGTASLVAKRITPEFRTRWKAAPDYERAAALSAFGDDFRAVCEDARGQPSNPG